MGVFVVADSVVSCFFTLSGLPLGDVCIRRYILAVLQRSTVINKPHVESISDRAGADSRLRLDAISRTDTPASAAGAVCGQSVSYVVFSFTSTAENVVVSGRRTACRR